MSNGRLKPSYAPRPQYLRDEVEKLQKWTLNTERSLKEKEGKLQQCSGETESHLNEVLALQKINENLNSEIQQLRHEKKELSDKVDETKSQTNLLTEQSTKLANQIDNIEASQSTVMNAQAVKENQLHSLFQQFQRLKLTKDQKLETENDKLQNMEIESKNLEGTEAIKNLETKLATTKKDLDEIENEKKYFLKESENHAQYLKNKENEVFKFKLSRQTALKELEGTKIASVILEDNLKSTLKLVADNIEKIGGENVEFSKSLEEKKSEIEILLTEKEKLNKMNIDIKSKLDTQMSIRIGIQKDVDIATFELSDCNEKMEKLKPLLAEIDIMNQDITMLTEDLNSCKKKKEVAEKEVVELKKVQKQKFILEEENVTLSGKIKVLEDKINKINSSHKESFKKNNIVQKNNEEIKLKINEKDIELDALNLGMEKKKEDSSLSNATILALQESVADLDNGIKLLENSSTILECQIQEKTQKAVSNNKRSESQIIELTELKKKIETINSKIKESVVLDNNISMEMQEKCSSFESNKSKYENLVLQKQRIDLEVKNKKEEEKQCLLKHTTLLKNLEIEVNSKDELTKQYNQLCEDITLIDKEIEITNHSTDDDCNQAIEDGNKKIKQLEKDLKYNEKCIATNEKREGKIIKQIETIDIELTNLKSELQLSNDRIKLVQSKVTTTNNEISQKKKHISAANTKCCKVTKTLNDKTKGSSNLQSDVLEMEKKLNAVKQLLIEQTQHQKDMVKKMDSSLETIGNEHRKVIEKLQEEKSDLTDQLVSIHEKINTAEISKKTKKAQEKNQEDSIVKTNIELQKEKAEIEKARQAQKEGIKNKNFEINIMKRELKKLKSNPQNGIIGDQIYSSTTTSSTVRDRLNKNIATPLRIPVINAKEPTHTKSDLTANKFKSNDVYKFDSNSDSDAFSMDVDFSKAADLKSLIRGGPPTPLSVTRFKPNPKYSRSTPQKENPVPLSSKSKKQSTEPSSMFNNILSPLSGGSESN